MNELDIHLSLLANIPIEIEGIGQFQLPTIREIIKMGYSKYLNTMSYLLFSKNSLSDTNEEIDQMSDFELLITYNYQVETFRNALFSSFELFLKSKPILLVDGMICFDEISVNKMLTDDKWKLIQKFVKLAHFVQEEEPYVAGNEKAKKLIEKIRKNKKENAPKQEEKANLHSILSGVAWRTDGIDSLLNKTIYQLYDGYYRLGFIDNYHQVCTGIYTGNVDGSKIKLPDINWANVIKIN